MVQRLARTAFPGFGAGGRCPVTAIIWFLAGWLLLLQVYTSLFPAQPRLKVEQGELWSRASTIRRDLEEQVDEDRFSEIKRLRDEVVPVALSPKQKSAAQQAANKAKLAFYFPDKTIAINPVTADEEDRQVFYPAREWLDTDGKSIQAHGGGILYVKETGIYYWYGENKDGRTYRPSKRSTARVDVIGISCYSSRDLWAWKNEGLVLKGDKINKSSDLHVSNVVERPKVIYNEKTKQYVMWMHVDNVNYSKASVGIAVSTKPTGPFTYLRSMRPHKQDSRDMTLFKDDNGLAYLLYSSKENSELHIGVLSPDYLDLRRGMRRILIGQHREAPAVFKHKGIYYMITSGCTGWMPNSAQVHAAKSMLGPWESIGDPCVGGPPEFRSTTFVSQATFVLPLPGLPDTFLFMADRWRPTDLRDSRYVWLPLTMDGPVDEPMDEEFDFPIWQRVSVYWYRRWKLPAGWNDVRAVALSKSD
ncbi:hypothetical protein R1sor_022795 [Riccia sorocarpa]|uniref:Uncharacterized protein n=1 Tax=Riccia sorocarpa TaxID=122646 RepID=A0ABD3GQ44_9MARC